MARNDPTIYMRIPQSLKDALDAASAENKRSLTAEVVARLESSFAAQPPALKSNTSEAEMLRDELMALVERKRKNQEVLAHLREAGISTKEIFEVFESELQEFAPKALRMARRLIELGESNAVKSISEIPRSKN